MLKVPITVRQQTSQTGGYQAPKFKGTVAHLVLDVTDLMVFGEGE
jgi:hypothetical protein